MHICTYMNVCGLGCVGRYTMYQYPFDPPCLFNFAFCLRDFRAPSVFSPTSQKNHKPNGTKTVYESVRLLGTPTPLNVPLINRPAIGTPSRHVFFSYSGQHRRAGRLHGSGFGGSRRGLGGRGHDTSAAPSKRAITSITWPC